MMLYCVRWILDKNLSKGKGKTKESTFVFTVLCDSIKDVHKCLEFYWHSVYNNNNGLTLDDGEIRMQRMTIDSRKFIAHYLMLDGMREPFYLTNPASNALRAHQIFGV